MGQPPRQRFPHKPALSFEHYNCAMKTLPRLLWITLGIAMQLAFWP
jgi:hypothetical protein